MSIPPGNMPPEIPAHFREKELGDILKDRVNAGGSCAIVTMASSGKSNLIRLLERRDVLDYHHQGGNLTLPSNHYVMLLIDPHLSLLPRADKNDPEDSLKLVWQGYEHILHRLYYEVTMWYLDWQKEEGRGEVWDLQDLYERLVETRNLIRNRDGSNPLYATLAIRYLENALGFFFHMLPDARIVIMFDEFEKTLKCMPPDFFQALRGLRDEHKYKLLYLTFTRAEFEELMADNKDAAQYEAFLELFSTKHPELYDERDGDIMLNRLMARQETPWPAHDNRRSLIHQASGGHAGLIRAIFKARRRFEFDSQMSVEQLKEAVWEHPSVRSECITLWRSFSDQERATLLEIREDSTRVDRQDPIAARLARKHLLIPVQQKGWEINPPMLGVFVKKTAPEELFDLA